MIEMKEVISKLAASLSQCQVGDAANGVLSSRTLQMAVDGRFKLPFSSAEQVAAICGLEPRDVLLAMVQAYFPELYDRLCRFEMLAEVAK
jgi:hypothetical protein